MSRRAVAFLGMPQVARMLALPEGLRALAVRDDFQRDGVAVLIEGDALDEQPEGVELPRLPVELFDPTALARQAIVTASWCNDGTAELDVWCPLRDRTPCQWSKEGNGVTLALLTDAVQQHLAEAHGTP